MLTGLFGVVVTAQVITELRKKLGAPGSSVPERSWISVQTPKVETLEQVRQELGAGAGESASIALGILVLIHRTGRASRVPEAEFALLEAHGMWLSERLKGGVFHELGGD